MSNEWMVLLLLSFQLQIFYSQTTLWSKLNTLQGLGLGFLSDFFWHPYCCSKDFVRCGKRCRASFLWISSRPGCISAGPITLRISFSSCTKNLLNHSNILKFQKYPYFVFFSTLFSSYAIKSLLLLFPNHSPFTHSSLHTSFHYWGFTYKF